MDTETRYRHKTQTHDTRHKAQSHKHRHNMKRQTQI